MSSSAVSTHVVESTVINAPQEAVWSSLGNLTFSWWNLVESCAPSGEGTCNTVGSLFDVRYQRVRWEYDLTCLLILTGAIQRRHTMDHSAGRAQVKNRLYKTKLDISFTHTVILCSNINKSLTFEVIACEPSAPFTSAIHTLSVKKVTMTNATFVEWVTDFSNDGMKLFLLIFV